MKMSVRFQLTALFCLLAAASAAQEAPAQKIAASGFDTALMLRAFQHSFPGKAGEVSFADKDWTIQAGGETFYWAEGRLLPAAEKDKAASYSPWSFEVYPAVVPSPAIYSDSYIEALRRRGNEAERGAAQHPGFPAILYGGKTRKEIEALLTQVEFLNKKINVHQEIAEALKRIDAEIRAEAKREAAAGNSELTDFIASIGQAGGYNWRDIRGSRRMSYHSWGLAVDIQPKNPGRKAVYWLWEKARNNNWMTVPLEERWKPPDRVIEAFEREGFIWGGKWPLYDAMHFEYRPELHELNRLLAAANENSMPVSFMQRSQDLHHLYPDKIE
jgi:hypothetical protein